MTPDKFQRHGDTLSEGVKKSPRHLLAVIPAKAGNQNIVEGLGPGFRRGDVNILPR